MAANTPRLIGGNFVCVDCASPLPNVRADGSKHRPPVRCNEHARQRVALLGAIYRHAHGSVARAIRSGALKRPAEFDCVDCGQPASQYDHRDYGKPLDVEPVCRSCNKRRGPALLPALEVEARAS